MKQKLKKLDLFDRSSVLSSFVLCCFQSSLHVYLCPHDLLRVASGKYRIGEDKRILLMRVLNDRVLVRVGGGWMVSPLYLIQLHRN